MRAATNLRLPWPQTSSTNRGKWLSMIIFFNLLFMLLPLAPFTHAEIAFGSSSSGGGTALHAGTNIVSVVQETQENSLVVYIVADRNIRGYKNFPLSSPPRLVIDLFDVQGSQVRETMQGNNQFVKSIRIGTSHKDKVRVVFDLRSSTIRPSKISTHNNRLEVTFGDTSTASTAHAAPIAQPIPVPHDSARNPNEASGPDNHPQLQAASVISNLELEVHDRETQIHIVADGKLTRYDSFVLSDPPKLIVDLSGVESALDSQAILFHNPLVKGVRLESPSQNQLRLVFELTPSANPTCQIIPKGRRLVASITAAEASVPNTAFVSPSILEQPQTSGSQHIDSRHASTYGWAAPRSRVPSENSTTRTTTTTDARAMFCSNCGHENHNDFNYCPKCGSQLLTKNINEPTTGNLTVRIRSIGGGMVNGLIGTAFQSPPAYEIYLDDKKIAETMKTKYRIKNFPAGEYDLKVIEAARGCKDDPDCDFVVWKKRVCVFAGESSTVKLSKKDSAKGKFFALP